MRKTFSFPERINIRILAVMLILFAITAAVVSVSNRNILRRLYEESFTERALLCNALIANTIDSQEVNHFVELMHKQDDDFKRQQVQFYYDREELFRLQKAGVSPERQQELLRRLAAFHSDMAVFKPDIYWETAAALKQLKEASSSAYTYIMAYTGLVDKRGEKLYTYIFDSDDELVYDSPKIDGLGTCYTGEEALEQVYATKKQMDHVEYYAGDYGELYFAYAPILNEQGDVIAVLGTDLDPSGMNAAISASFYRFSSVFFASVVVIVLILYLFLRQSITKPLSSLTGTAYELAEGNIYAQTSQIALKQRGEIGMLAHAVNDMSLVYQDMIQSTANLFDAVNVGKLDIRNDASKFKGDMQNVIRQINDTLDSMTLYLNSIPEGIFIMGKDFQMHFRNDQFIQRFGEVSAAAFFSSLFPEGAQGGEPPQKQQPPLQEKVAAALRQGNNVAAWINGFCFSVILKEIAIGEEAENIVLVIVIDITDFMREKENAQAATEAKSNFLSRMSHEMRTPLSVIIGMAKIAKDTDEVSKLKYCLSTIRDSSEHLLGIINDVLDMSKIEAGKFELKNVPMNLEKMLVKSCNIVIDNIEKKKQKFHVVLDKDLDVNYIADDLRLSQVITNLLSNAVKFTPEGGKIALAVDTVSRQGNTSTLRLSVTDTGIGMTDEQRARLFNAFEQADGGISRKYGGTGLGLVISKNIVEKMGGRVWVESEYGTGSTFFLEVNLERAPHQDCAISSGIRSEDVTLLIVESDDDVMERFLSIAERFGMKADAASSAQEAVRLLGEACRANRAYDIVFLAYDMPNTNGLDIAKQFDGTLDMNTVIIITTFFEWRQIEKHALENKITRHIAKPIFPSSALGAICDVLEAARKSPDAEPCAADAAADLFGVHVLLAEDMEINREIFLALLKETRVSIDFADNGLAAVSKFQKNPDKYDLIIMDIQMPEMDGYQATQAIRKLDAAQAKTIPIIAMTANAFKEDVERCLACGMNDHLPKPIDEKAVIEKIRHYARHALQ